MTDRTGTADPGAAGIADPDREAIGRDRALAWELHRAQPRHPRIPQLARSVLARDPESTGMIILLARHHQACGEVEPARRLLRELMARRDRRFATAARDLRDLELADGRHEEALRLAELVLREAADADWDDRMEHAAATVFAVGAEAGWRLIDEAVERCAREDPDWHPNALAQRALRLLATGAPPERILAAAQEAIEADPGERAVSLALAFAYLYDYRAEEAAELLGRLLREDPTDAVAQGGMTVARVFLQAIERGVATMDELRERRLGEAVWRVLRDEMLGAGIREAFAALDAVLPADLARSLRPPLDEDAAWASGGLGELLAWHDGQEPGTGRLWRSAEAFRLMSAAEIDEMDEAIERDPAAWPQWSAEDGPYTQLLTDDAGAYLIKGADWRLYRRSPGEPDREIAASLTDWVWDRVVAFGGRDPRPWRAARAGGTASDGASSADSEGRESASAMAPGGAR